MQDVEAFEHDRNVVMHLETKPLVLPAEERMVVLQPVGPGAIAFSLVPSELVIDRRERPDPNIGRSDHDGRAAIATTRNPKIPDFGPLGTAGFKPSDDVSGGPFGAVGHEFDQLVGEPLIITELERLDVRRISKLGVLGNEARPESLDCRCVDRSQRQSFPFGHALDSK